MKKLFGRIFGSQPPVDQPVIRFGRFTDSYRSAEREQAFDAALTDFNRENYLAAFVSFFTYLNDESEQNVKVWEEKNELRFELAQGSKLVTGYANHNKFYAAAKVAKVREPKPSFMRRLLEANFDLKHARFALTPENEIAILFDTFTVDASPYKLYSALKELATHADKHDDILVEEFSSLEVTDFHIRRELPESEKATKYHFIIQKIGEALREIEQGELDYEQYPIAMTYLLLDLCYKLDYLTKPEGFLMESLERIHRLAFEQDQLGAVQKNLLLMKEFQKLLDRPREKYFAEMYEVSATFGITGPIEHASVVQVIDQELPNMQWYVENGHLAPALAIPGFIVGRLLFNFAVPPPDRDLLHLYYQIMEPSFFGELGYSTYYLKNLLDEKSVRQAIKRITDKHAGRYPSFNPNIRLLDFRSLAAFAHSYLEMVKQAMGQPV